MTNGHPHPQPGPYDQNYTSIMSLLQTLHANQLNMIGMLRRIINQESQMAIDVTALTAEVANNSTVSGSVVTLLQNLTTFIQNIPASTDPVTQAALDQLTATLAGNDTAVAAAVVQNTPASTTNPPPSSSGRR
jgi:hypothetical protein